MLEVPNVREMICALQHLDQELPILVKAGGDVDWAQYVCEVWLTKDGIFPRKQDEDERPDSIAAVLLWCEDCGTLQRHPDPSDLPASSP